jgi:hypothetical protein
MNGKEYNGKQNCRYSQYNRQFIDGREKTYSRHLPCTVQSSKIMPLRGMGIRLWPKYEIHATPPNHAPMSRKSKSPSPQ